MIVGRTPKAKKAPISAKFPLEESTGPNGPPAPTGGFPWTDRVPNRNLLPSVVFWRRAFTTSLRKAKVS